MSKILIESNGEDLTPRSPYGLTENQLKDFPVSTLSVFGQMRWKFANRTPGAAACVSTIDWALKLEDGSSLTDKRHSTRLFWAKRFVLTLIVSPASGQAPSPGSFGRIQRNLTCLISWMSLHGLSEPCELNQKIIDLYIQELPTFLNTDPELTGESPYVDALTALIHLWNQRSALKKFGIKSLPAHPFKGLGAITIARSIAQKARGRIKPLPDEIAILILNKAASLLSAPAQDMSKLVKIFEDHEAGQIVSIDNGRGGTRSQVAGKGNAARINRMKRALNSFQFSKIEGDTDPWHQPLDEKYGDNAPHTSMRFTRLAQLWTAFRDACAIIILALSGMRMCELLGIKAGVDPTTGLPKGVRIERSVTGLFEWFVIRTQLSKGTNGFPKEVDWVLGMRPVGGSEIPIAVNALLFLNTLYAPWQQNASTDLLILGMEEVYGKLPTKSRILRGIYASTLTRSIKGFISSWVDFSKLPDNSKRLPGQSELVPWKKTGGVPFKPTALRKTWASFTIRCNPKLLPVIKMQFHHAQLATTESAYIGNNPLYQEVLDSVNVQFRNSMIYEMVFGTSTFSGQMGEQLKKEAKKLKKISKSLALTERWKTVADWCDANRLSFFFNPYSTCNPTRKGDMRCHNQSGTPIWLRNKPNFDNRSPQLCAGCKCGIIDASHKPFWSERYLEYSQILKDCEVSRSKDDNGFAVIRFRTDQARAVLRRMGEDVDAMA